METKAKLTNGPLLTGNDDSLNRVSSEDSHQDDTTRDISMDGSKDGKEIVEDKDKERKVMSIEETKSLSNEVYDNDHPEMNTGADETAVLQELESNGDSQIVYPNVSEEGQGEIERSFSEGIKKQEKQEERKSKVENTELVELLKSEHDQHMEELRRTLEETYQKQVLKISDELRDHYQNDMEEKIVKLEEDWETEFTKQKLEFDGRVTAVQKEQLAHCQEGIERVTLDAEDQLKNMIHAHDRETAELKKRIQELLEKQTLSEIKEHELDEEKCQKEEENVDKIKQLKKQLSEERDEVETQIEVAKNEMNRMKEEHEKQMKNITTELERTHSNMLSEAKNEMKSKYQAELDEKVQRVESHLRQQYEQDLAKTTEELYESSITLKTKFEKELAEVVTQLEELHERNQQHELEKTTLKTDYKNTKKELQDEGEKKSRRIQELEKMNGEKNYQKILEEKKSLKDQLNDVSSQLLLLKEKIEEKAKEREELSSKHQSEMLNMKSIYEKVLVEKQLSVKQEEELSFQISLLKEKVDESEKEREESNEIYETEIVKIKNSYEKEVSTYKSELVQKNAAIADLEETSRVHELEIANLILQSPLSTESEEKEFNFEKKPEERIKHLKIEITKYKNKIKELEDEAEDKFETTLCHSCLEEGSRGEPELEAKALVEKIEKECKEKVENLKIKLETTKEKLNQQIAHSRELEEKLNQQIAHSRELEEKLRKIEIGVKNKSKECTELDINNNVFDAEKRGNQNEVEQEGLRKDHEGTKDDDEDSSQSELLVVQVEYGKVLHENEKFKIENSKKDSELSSLIKEKDKIVHVVENLREELRKRGQKCKYLTERALEQKTNYESEIELMQKEIEELIKESKYNEDKGKLTEKYQQDNIKLQMKIEEMETVMAENSGKHQEKIEELLQESKRELAEKYQQETIKLQMQIEEMETVMAENTDKHQEEIEKLKKIIQAKEKSSKDLQKMYEVLETQFDKKKRELLNEMHEKTAMFENEKNKILESSFQEKEELLTRLNELERSREKSRLWLNSDEERPKRNSKKKDHVGGMFYSHHLPSSTEKTWHTNHDEHLGIMDEQEWTTRDNQRTMEGQYDEQVDEIIGDQSQYEPQRENKGYNRDVLGYGWKDRVPEENERIMERECSEYGIEMVGYEEKNEYKDQMEIELLVEKEERERLRKELGTMSRCVEVFHEECQRLKNSLENTLDILNVVKEERNALAEKSEKSLEENSEIMMDLIKYEDIIKNLEKANEKLVQEKEILQRCLLQTGDKPSSRMEKRRENSRKSHLDENMMFTRSEESVEELRSEKIHPDLQEEILTEELSQSSGEEKPFQILTDLQKEKKEKDRGRYEERKTTQRYSRKNDFNLGNNFLSKQLTQDENKEYSLGEETERSDFNLRGKSLFLEQHPSEKDIYTSQMIEERKQAQRHHHEQTGRRHVTFTHDAAVPDECAGKTRGKKRAVQGGSRHQHLNRSTRGQFSEETLNQRNHSKKDGHKVGQNISTTALTRSSQNSKNSSRFSSSFLTSTISGLRLAPNLSGVSPIVSQLDRRRHNEMLKCRTTDDISSDVTQSNTTFRTTADSIDGRPTQKGPTIEQYSNLKNSSLTKTRKPAQKTTLNHARSISVDDKLLYSTREGSSLTWGEESYLEKPLAINFEDKTTLNHARSISVDDKLLYSTREGSSLTWGEESYLEKPLAINFEDFVFRHRVRSSEDIANLRDPSPAELWFS